MVVDLGSRLRRPAFQRMPGAPPEIVRCRLDINPHPVSFRADDGDPQLAHYDGDYHARPRTPGRDVDVCFGGRVALTAVPLDITGA